ncbi:MAG TPA: DUF2807 domain-containing protein [Dysgonamonadaceae bacterium]|nr:DUF2807 domain-containing protein [Dysgonamonadaceae bacterium]
MKKIILLLLLPIFSLNFFPQEKPKIIGTRNVSTTAKNIEEIFNAIEVDDGLKVELIQGMENSYRLTADENLQDVIKFEVNGDVLRISTTSKITSSEKIEVVLYFNNLNEIVLKNNAEVYADTKIKSNHMQINAYNSSVFDLDIISDDHNHEHEHGVAVVMRDNAYGKLKVQIQTVTLALSDNANLVADISTDKTTVELIKSAKLNLDGNSDEVAFYAMDSSELDARKMKVSSAKLIVSDYAQVHLDAKKHLDLQAKNNCNIFLYSTPDKEVKKITDSALITMK